MRFKLLLLIIILKILLATEAPADAKKSPDIPSFDWQVLQFPNTEKVYYGLFLSDSVAWISTAENKLMQYQLGQWQFDPRFSFELAAGIFGRKKPYVISKNKLSARWRLQARENGCWKMIETPNSEMIRGVHFVAPDNIWAACEWGELLHLDEKKWHLIAGPSFGHNSDIFYQSDSSIWVAGEYYNKKSVSHWTGKHWVNYVTAQSGEKESPFLEVQQLIPLNNDACLGLMNNKKDSVLLLKNDGISLVGWDELVADTLIRFIPFYQDSIPLFVKDDESVTRRGRVYSASEEFLIFDQYSRKYAAYWKAANNKIYFIRFLPSQYLSQTNSLFKEFEIPRIVYAYGSAFIDVDKDSHEELFIIDTEARNKLFKIDSEFFEQTRVHKPPTDLAEKYNIAGKINDKNGKSIFDHSVSFGDIGNDGDEDAYVTSLYKNNLFYENRNGKFFKEKAKQAGIDIGITRSVMGIWCDVNNDGKLDLFVTNEDTTNMLFLNRGGGNFVNVTENSGLKTAQRGNGACFGDLDMDGDQDLVVTFQNIRDKIYRNDTPRGSNSDVCFTDMTEKWWTAQKDTNIKSTGCVPADYDNDGDLDLFVAHKIFTNRLYENDGSGHLRDVTFEAGLADSGISNSAGFFDADNDGDLDLYVANRANDVFYENLGNKRFQINLGYFGKSEPLNTTDFACGDPDNDGDIDCVLPRGVVGKSLFLRNELNNRNFIKIKLIGVKSNRSAIGAKTFLYEAGHLDEIAFCKGLREVISSSGFGSMNSHSVHYGVSAAKRYDLRVIFPSGINIVRKNVSAGSFLQISEQKGLIAVSERAKQFALFTIKNRERLLELAKLLLFVLLIYIGGKILIWKRKLDAKNLKFVIASGLAPYVILKFVNGNLANPYPESVLLLIPVLATAIAILISARRKIVLSRDLMIEELNLSCRNFNHGNWAASHFNQLQLFSSNLRSNKKLSAEIGDEIFEAITDFYEYVYIEIFKIAELARKAKIEVGETYDLEKYLLAFSDLLNKMKVELRLKQKISRDMWEKSSQFIENIKKSIKAIGAETQKYFHSDLFHVLQKTINRFQQQSSCIVVADFPANEGKIVPIREPDLMAIFENLLNNADNAMHGQPGKEIHLEYCEENKTGFVRVKDKGIGIPKNQWGTIFQQNFTTKQRENGGFGLYFARVRLEKYGGSISVERSSAKKGTTFLVSLPLV